MVAPHSAARESTTQLAWDLLQPSRSHRLARAAATSSTALHWVESRHCTALHCTSIMILQNIFQLDKPCCSVMLSLLQSQQHSVILK